MKNYIDLFENADDDDVPAELTTDESTQINRRVYSSDCQESVLVNNKGHIKQSDRTMFVDKIGCSVWTSRVNQLLVSSYASETDHHFGKNTDQNDESNGESSRRKVHRRVKKHNKEKSQFKHKTPKKSSRKLKPKKSSRSKSKLQMRIHNESSTSTHFGSSLRVPEHLYDSFSQNNSNQQKFSQIVRQTAVCRVANDDDFIARNITVKDLLPCIVS